jgi:hypothetical protein
MDWTMEVQVRQLLSDRALAKQHQDAEAVVEIEKALADYVEPLLAAVIGAEAQVRVLGVFVNQVKLRDRLHRPDGTVWRKRVTRGKPEWSRANVRPR